ncbi:long-chain fatty acid--CoA ligase [Xenophilus arseniciresistens]|uniref:Long-chain fatty acid--CoA ligase n=1 Tax=Xenophilus arseniciresistens TaxID=1283306 RepID=A0AAE3NDJ6_9BURK|nr:long-chain fatty acid--CoA ligase [Xenophilus arseniciresistens]MDA7417644.1 long-chain fatty acid--CoA ligase [Xenophilus arseniciresistens]
MTSRPWLKSYPEGMSWNAPLKLTALTALLADAVRQWPQRTALRQDALVLSYAELAQHVRRVAGGLRELGVQPGVHVGLYLPNVPQYIVAFFAVLQAGGTVVNYSPLDAGQTLRHKVEDSQTRLMITFDAPELLSKMEAIAGEGTLQTLVVARADDFSADVPSVAPVQAAARVPFSTLLAAAPLAQPHVPSDIQTAIAVLQYTGGTTGQPKGAMLSHANLSAAVSQVWHTLVASGTLEEGEERFLAVLPLFHIYALVVNMLFGLSIGAELSLHQRFDLEATLREFVQRKTTVFLGVPTMYVAFTGHPDIGKLDLSSLKFCNSGGAPIAAEVYQAFVRMAQCRLQEGWGMTETCTMATASPGFSHYRPGSCGIPVPGVDVKVIDLKDQHDLPEGEHGELCIRGPNVMAGYWNRPEATAESMTADGYLRTGDVGYMTPDGFVYIVDRTKDMLICGGFNVYPRNIEEAIHRHPSVEEVIVIGIPDAYRGQSPKAFIKFKPGAARPTLDELKTFLADYLGKHEMLQAMEAREELPRTAVGKLSKKDLQAELAGSA